MRVDSNDFLLTLTPWRPDSEQILLGYQTEFDLSAYRDSLFDELRIHFPEQIQRSVKKRRAEFLAGRYCCAMSLADLGFSDAQVHIGPHRNPLWPAGIKGSVSHKPGCAVAIVSNDIRILGVGVDIEDVQPEAFVQTKRLFLNAREENRLHIVNRDYACILALVFSAKESFFKMAYPYVGRYFEFNAVEVLEIDRVGKIVVLRTTVTLHHHFPEGRVFAVQFDMKEETVTTALSPLRLHAAGAQ